MNGAVNLVVAHPLEAKALIEWFNLEEIEPRGKFRCYGNKQEIALVICGVGVRNAADAVDWMHGRQAPGMRAWLNLGIAGHRNAALGEGFLIHRIEDRNAGQFHWPPVANPGQPSCPLITVDAPESAYPQDCAYDMEAAGFFAAAAGLVPSDLVSVFKIISDNRAQPVAELDLNRVPELIRHQESAIRQLVAHLRSRSAAFADWHALPAEYETLLNKHRFSATRRAALARLCRRFRALGRQRRLGELARRSFPGAAALMQALESELSDAQSAEIVEADG